MRKYGQILEHIRVNGELCFISNATPGRLG